MCVGERERGIERVCVGEREGERVSKQGYEIQIRSNQIKSKVNASNKILKKFKNKILYDRHNVSKQTEWSC